MTYDKNLASSYWWGMQTNSHPQSLPDVRFFRTKEERDAWVKSGLGRDAVGVRNFYVKQFRRKMEGGKR